MYVHRRDLLKSLTVQLSRFSVYATWWKIPEDRNTDYGGKKLPVLKGKCDTVTMMSYGFDPVSFKLEPITGQFTQ